MMHELSPGQYSTVLPLLEGIGHKAVYALSVIEQVQRGRIFVNDEQRPTAIFVTSSGGFYCLAGQEDDGQFSQSVIGYMNDQSNHNGFFALGIFSDGWDMEINKYRIDHAKKIQRSYYRFNRERFKERYADEVISFDDGYDYSILNEKISEEYRERFYPYYKLVWDSNEHYCQYGLGHFLFRDSELISVCSSPYISGSFAEIDIVTIESYQRKGLATKLGVAFIKECLIRQLTPNWCCNSDNIESNNLAIKLGFEKIDERPMYWYQL